jgi:hypothetical protein
MGRLRASDSRYVRAPDVGERTTRRPSPSERRHGNLLGRGRRHPGRGLGLCGILFQIGELQFELIEQRAMFR